MGLKDLLLGNGVVTLKNNYSSMSVIRGTLEKKYFIRVIEESTYHMKCKMMRSARLFGGPVLFPNPTLTIDLRYTDQGATITYSFEWPDYYVAFAASISIALSFALWRGNGNISAIVHEGLKEFIFILCFSVLCVFIDNRWFTSKVRSILATI